MRGSTRKIEPISQGDDEEREELNSHRHREVYLPNGCTGAETINDTAFAAHRRKTTHSVTSPDSWQV